MYTDKYMPPSVDIKIKLIRNSPTFGILHAEDDKSFKVVWKDLKLKMRKVLPIEQQRQRFRMIMAQQPCYIPFKLSLLKVFVIPAGVTSYNVTNIALQMLPKQVIFALIHYQALTHDSKFNPFDFQHFDLNYFNLIRTVNASSRKLFSRISMMITTWTCTGTCTTARVSASRMAHATFHPRFLREEGVF